MKINADKTKAMIISSKNRDQKWNIGLTIDGNELETTDEFKFLLVTIDNGLRFTGHINRVVDKCRKRVNIIKSLSWKDWGNSLETQRTLYLQYIRSCLEYASSSWAPWTSETGKTKLERVQNSALRSMTGLARTCQVDFLNLETNVEPLKERYRKNDKILFD